MNLIQPREWALDETTSALLADLDQSAYQINELRPLSHDLLHEVRDKLLGERVFSSNAIEGNTLTLRETSLILQTGSVLGSTHQREAQEALNLGAAYREIERLVVEEKGIYGIDTFISIHGLLMRGVNDGIAARLRNRDVMIRAARIQPPDLRVVSELMDQFFEFLAEETGRKEGARLHSLVLATWGHWAIARIHPFEDGNGRMARLWQDLLLLHGRLTVAIIRPEDRSLYYEALGAADDGDCNLLVQLVCRRVMSTMQLPSHSENS